MLRREVVEVLSFLASTYANDAIDDKTVRAWAVVLQNTPRLWAARAAMRWVESERWMPKVAELKGSIDREMRSTYWRPPEQARDEAQMWLCFTRGCGPDELTEGELR